MDVEHPLLFETDAPLSVCCNGKHLNPVQSRQGLIRMEAGPVQASILVMTMLAFEEGQMKLS